MSDSAPPPTSAGLDWTSDDARDLFDHLQRAVDEDLAKTQHLIDKAYRHLPKATAQQLAAHARFEHAERTSVLTRQMLALIHNFTLPPPLEFPIIRTRAD